jgi:hypothetical protein
MKEFENLLNGRRILHINSPVRWQGQRYKHNSDSNWKVMIKTISFLPNCHHFITVPFQNELEDFFYEKKNITIIPMSYPQSVTLNRTQFDYKPLVKQLDVKGHDFDFIFCHQPELLNTVISSFISERIGTKISSFNFFHWVDCNKSRLSSDAPEGYFRQLEAIHLSSKSFVHNKVTIDYLNSNFSKKSKSIIDSVDQERLKDKISFMPLSSDVSSQKSEFQKMKLPKNKKILVFNHRWNVTTNPEMMMEYTRSLSSDYIIWVTDENSMKPLAGRSIHDYLDNKTKSNVIETENGPTYVVKKCETLEEYRYLMKECFAEICFVNGYATWNMASQDSVFLGRPALVYDHPIMQYVLGKDYPLMFKTKEEFKNCVNKVSIEKFDWELPNHDGFFKENLLNAMINSDTIKSKIDEDIETDDMSMSWKTYGIIWLYHILNGNLTYKADLLLNTHPKLPKTNTWGIIRSYLLSLGITDDCNSRYTKYSIPENKKKEIEDLVNSFISQYGIEKIYENVTQTDSGVVGTVLKDDSFKEKRIRYESNKKVFVENSYKLASIGMNNYKNLIKNILTFLEKQVNPDILKKIEEKFSGKLHIDVKSKSNKNTIGSKLSRFLD